jgi:hypothetical protein
MSLPNHKAHGEEPSRPCYELGDPQGPVLALSERLTPMVSCHWSHSRTLTQCSTTYTVSHLRPSVTRLGRSTRCVALLPRTLVSLSSPHASRPLYGGACSGPMPLAADDHHRMGTHEGART